VVEAALERLADDLELSIPPDILRFVRADHQRAISALAKDEAAISAIENAVRHTAGQALPPAFSP